jgi:serine/threonine protein phosphatase PrpC
MTRGKYSSPLQSAAPVPAQSLPLFAENSSIDIVPGTLNDDSLVREVITDAIKRSVKSREQIAEEMSRTLGVTVTARMITSFTSESKELHRWPGAWDRAFCVAVGDTRLLFCRVEAAGYLVIDKTGVALLELGAEYLKQKRASERVLLLEAGLRGVDL